MENAAEALKMAGFVLLFVLALGLAMTTLTQARTAAGAIIYSEDDRKDYGYVDESEYVDTATSTYKTSRVVKMDDVIPTLYRYYKENYRVEFVGLDQSHPLYTNTKGEKVFALDLDDEMNNNEAWKGSNQATKENLDKIIKQVLLRYYKDDSFKEDLGIEEDANPDLDQSKQNKRVIRYTLI